MNTGTNGLAAVVVDLLDDLRAARSERDAFRMIAVEAARRLHERHLEIERLREQHHRLLTEYRTHRAATIGALSRAA